jgi:hypothetical protein
MRISPNLFYAGASVKLQVVVALGQKQCYICRTTLYSGSLDEYLYVFKANNCFEKKKKKSQATTVT